jgi:uncharacterized phiE125 gp8 family phage protein
VTPTAEPVTLDELKLHLKIDSGTLSDNLAEVQSIAPGSHATTTGYTLVGATVAMTSDTAIVSVQAGTNGATGTVDIKIQESDTGAAPWTDWTGGSFAQITTANDNAMYKKEYTGNKAYIRTVAQVLLAACEFGTTVIQYAPTSAEDALLITILTAARQHVENITGRQLMTAEWDYVLNDWPHNNSIKLPYGNLQSVTFVKWKDTSGMETTLIETTDYIVDTNGDQCGAVVLPFGRIWPTPILYPATPITIRYVCGYASAALVPEILKVAIKFAAQNMWRHGGDDKAMKDLVELLTYNYRLHDEF